MKIFYTFAAIISAAAIMLTLAGCKAVGPDYEGVEWKDLRVDDLLNQEGAEITADEITLWWRVFDDPVLTNLVESALMNNLKLADSLAQVREARALLGVSRAGLLPVVDSAGSYSRYRNSDNAGLPADGDNYRAGFDASWEVDIFGRRRRSIEAARADFEAACATYENVWVVVAAETANAYVAYQELCERLHVAESNLKLQQDTLDILSSRMESGIGDDLAVEQARYNLEQTRASVPEIRSGMKQVVNALAVLTGVMPGEFRMAVESPEKMLSVPVRTLTGIPASALRKRPDIRAAERRLAARCASIGVAEADLYPTFALNGSIGLESLSSSDFLDTDSRFYSWGPSVSWPIFHGGSIRANIEIQKALHEQAFISYELTVLDAVAELRNNLTAYVHEYERLESLQKAAGAARNAVDIAQDQYSQGLSDFTNVLDAQRSLLKYEELVVISRATIARNLIGVYKALGGGWRQLR
ncbi:MAG: TolC family protein [Kiritimatiellia bacterium]